MASDIFFSYQCASSAFLLLWTGCSVFRGMDLWEIPGFIHSLRFVMHHLRNYANGPLVVLNSVAKVSIWKSTEVKNQAKISPFSCFLFALRASVPLWKKAIWRHGRLYNAKGRIRRNITRFYQTGILFYPQWDNLMVIISLTASSPNSTKVIFWPWGAIFNNENHVLPHLNREGHRNEVSDGSCGDRHSASRFAEEGR